MDDPAGRVVFASSRRTRSRVKAVSQIKKKKNEQHCPAAKVTCIQRTTSKLNSQHIASVWP